MLAIALFATLFSNVFINGVAFLIPTLHTDFGLNLALAGLVSAMPKFGMVPTLIPWGYVVDRAGERFVLWVGSALTAAAALGAALSHSLVVVAAFLFLGGMAAASSNSASGRLVVGWFPAEQRGLAMGIRQTAQPLGVGLGALVMPQLAHGRGIGAALLFPAAVCALAAVVCLLAVTDPPRPPRAEASPQDLANPYRGSQTLWRIHAVSVLLVVPQALVWTFALVWMMSEHGWSPAAAGVLVTVSQILGALGRIAAGRWSDTMGARLRPIRIIAAAAAMIRMGRRRAPIVSDHRPAAIRPSAPRICETVTRTPAAAGDHPCSLIIHTSAKVHTSACGTTSSTETAWMRHSVCEPRYGLARSCGEASARGGRGGSVTASRHTTAARAHTAAGNSRAAPMPRPCANCGITSAPKPTPSGWAVWRIPIARPRCSAGNHPTTSRPLAELLLAAAIPPRNRKAATTTSEWDSAAPNAAAAVSAEPTHSTNRSPARSTT